MLLMPLIRAMLPLLIMMSLIRHSGEADFSFSMWKVLKKQKKHWKG